MHFNLIDEEWIPVTRRNGEEVMIAPWQITEGFYENPIVSLNAPRPDFNGALVQFLIGLVQTTAAPANKVDWKTKLNRPPAPEELKARFASDRHAFELGGDGPRFMQDIQVIAADERAIDRLLIDMPGDITLRENRDHFIKRYSIKQLCPMCCTIALFAMQTNAPAGGPGFRTSLRGGGPLTTLVMGDAQHDTLWHLVWLNVLEQAAFSGICGNSMLSEDKFMYPWLAETRTSEEKGGMETTPADAHPVMMFWGMPRRIRLNLNALVEGQCDVCGQLSGQLITNYQDKNYGMNFTGAWLHPLSPYTLKENDLLPVHGQPGGVTYRHWLGFVQEDGKERVPARIVHEFRNTRQQNDWQFRVWAFGYDMDKMKARCWYESKIPLLHVDLSMKSDYDHYVAGLIKAAVDIVGNVRIAIKNSINGKPEVNPVTGKIDWKYRDVKKMPADEDKRKAKILYAMKNKSVFEEVGASFWQNTESAFYETLYELKTSLESGSDCIETLRAWHASLCKEAMKLFDAYALEGPIENADSKRVVLARRDLERFNYSNKIKDLLGLPVVQSQTGKTAKKKPKK